MSLLILNGSPRGKNNSNTNIFINQFVKEMTIPYEIKQIVGEDPAELANYLRGFDTVIFTMPLYIHAMPGAVMKLFEHMIPIVEEGKSIGFIVQAGFVETEQQKYLIRFFKIFATRLHYNYLGTIQKGDAMSISVFPERFNRKLFSQLNKLGKVFEETGAFDVALIEQLRQPYRLSKRQVTIYQLCIKVGLNSFSWSIMQHKNGAYKQRRSKPFVSATK